MSTNQVSAMKSEIARVKELKRNVEGALELVRSDAEKGKIHLRVSDDAAFRQAVAEAIVTEAHPGYSTTYQGGYFADPVEGKVYHRQSQAAWNPWSDDVDWRIVSVDELVRQDGNDFNGEVDWDVVDVPYREMVAAYLEDQEEKFEANGDIPEWIDRSDVVSFAREQDEWRELLEQIEQDAHAEAVSFARSEILDEIVVQPFEGN